MKEWKWNKLQASGYCRLSMGFIRAKQKFFRNSFRFVDGRRDYYIPASAFQLIDPAFIHSYTSAFDRLTWQSFDHYATMRCRMWIVSIYGDDWKHARCNCPVFFKRGICKHSLGVAIRKGFCQPPAVAKSIPIGERRKPGRPPLARAGTWWYVIRLVARVSTFGRIFCRNRLEKAMGN